MACPVLERSLMSNATPGNNNPFNTAYYPCFDVSGFRFLTPIQFRIYKDSWNTFNRVQSYNSNISTLRHAGQLNLNYYQFVTMFEMSQYRQGQQLHVQIYPTSNWSSVPPN